MPWGFVFSLRIPQSERLPRYSAGSQASQRGRETGSMSQMCEATAAPLRQWRRARRGGFSALRRFEICREACWLILLSFCCGSPVCGLPLLLCRTFGLAVSLPARCSGVTSFPLYCTTLQCRQNPAGSKKRAAPSVHGEHRPSVEICGRWITCRIFPCAFAPGHCTRLFPPDRNPGCRA